MCRTLLEKDPRLRALRFKIVPARISEDDFWEQYFEQLIVRVVEHVKEFQKLYLEDMKKAEEEQQEKEEKEANDSLRKSDNGNGASMSPAVETAHLNAEMENNIASTELDGSTDVAQSASDLISSHEKESLLADSGVISNQNECERGGSQHAEDSPSPVQS